MLRQRARITGGAGRRIERGALHVFGKHELRHGLEHRHFDPLANAGARARQQSGEQRIGRRRTDNAVDRRHRDEARLAGGALQQHRNPRRCLDQVVVGRAPGIAPAAAVADHAEIHDGGVELLHQLIVEPEASECLRTNVRSERIDSRHQPQQRVTRRRLLEVHCNAALATRVVLKTAAHTAMARPAGIAGSNPLRAPRP